MDKNGSYVQYGLGAQSSAGFNGSSSLSDHSGDPSSSSSPGAPNMNLIVTIRLLMQGKEVGSIIGKRGDQVKRIREDSGAKVNISDGACPERIVTVTGSLPNINKAFEMICNKFEEDMLALPNCVPKPPITMRLIVPATQCGSLIGKGGTKIKEIREATGASIQVASEMLPNSTERAVTVSGTADAIVLCIAQVAQILLEAPPKGATIQFRPKPAYNPLLIAQSAAVAAQQQQFGALLQTQLLQAPLFNPADLSRAALPFGAPAAGYLQPTATAAAATFAPQDYSLLAGNGFFIPGLTAAPTGLPQADKGLLGASGWPEDEQLKLLNQYAALNNSVLMGAPLLKSTPSTSATSPATAATASTGGHKQASARYTPY